MITSISTNFGMNQIALKCYDSAKIVVLQGSFIIDTNNEDYKNSEQQYAHQCQYYREDKGLMDKVSRLMPPIVVANSESENKRCKHLR